MGQNHCKKRSIENEQRNGRIFDNRDAAIHDLEEGKKP